MNQLRKWDENGYNMDLIARYRSDTMMIKAFTSANASASSCSSGSKPGENSSGLSGAAGIGKLSRGLSSVINSEPSLAGAGPSNTLNRLLKNFPYKKSKEVKNLAKALSLCNFRFEGRLLNAALK